MGVPGVASQMGHGSELGGRHRVGLERQEGVHRCHLAGSGKPRPGPPYEDEALA